MKMKGPSIDIWLKGEKKHYTIDHVELFRILTANIIVVKCFGNRAVKHRNVSRFEMRYEVVEEQS